MGSGAVSREDQVRAEAELARQLLAASDAERQGLYGVAYDHVFSMAFAREPDVLDFGATAGHIPTLVRETKPGDRVLEIGCGTGLLAIALRDRARKVTGVDVSQVVLDRAVERAGDRQDITFRRVDGVRLPFGDGTFDFAYSVEFVEHLHGNDAVPHFTEVARVLRPAGRYWFLTPSRYDSADAAERFAVEVDISADLHLREWTHHEVQPVLKQAGFHRIAAPLAHSGWRAKVSMPGAAAALLERVPRLPRSRIGRGLGLNECIVRAVKR